MKPVSAISIPDSPDRPWRSLHVFNFYRLIIAGVIAVIFFFTRPGDTTFGISSPRLFAFAILCWVAVSLASGFASRLRWKHYRWQVSIIIFLDIFIISLLIYASGGTESGLGTLMLVTIAASGILISGRMTLAFAALATLFLLLIQGYLLLTEVQQGIGGYTRIGLLGVGLFSVALLTHLLAGRIRESEALAKQRGEEISDLNLINQMIIQQMDTGILVINAERKVLTSNDAAARLLGLDSGLSGRTLSSLSRALDKRFDEWRDNPAGQTSTFTMPSGNTEILPQFRHIGGQSSTTYAVFLEDTAKLRQQAQQARLASLGRLTASIAHEIRNPLSAINHAGQLLAESDKIGQDEVRFTEIIGEQSGRLNTIVESVLALSRKENFAPDLINIDDWLQRYVEKSYIGQTDCKFDIDMQSENATIRFDPAHLDQVIGNLCDNAIKHCGDNPDGGRVSISTRYNKAANEVEVNILDDGPGVAQDNIDKLFEPFYTTHASGTGLGLFIARELTSLNSANLVYIATTETGAHFRLRMPRMDHGRE